MHCFIWCVGLPARYLLSDSSRQRATTIIGKALQRTRNSQPSDLVAENKGHAGMTIVALLGLKGLAFCARTNSGTARKDLLPSPLLFLFVSGVTPHIRSLM
jgi:hypothetical protein